jgi:hypothetical protein
VSQAIGQDKDDREEIPRVLPRKARGGASASLRHALEPLEGSYRLSSLLSDRDIDDIIALDELVDELGR